MCSQIQSTQCFYTTSMCYHPVPKEWNEPEDSDNNDDDKELQLHWGVWGRQDSLIFRWTYNSRREKKNGNDTWPSKYTSQSEATSRKTVWRIICHPLHNYPIEESSFIARDINFIRHQLYIRISNRHKNTAACNAETSHNGEKHIQQSKQGETIWRVRKRIHTTKLRLVNFRTSRKPHKRLSCVWHHQQQS